MVHLFGLAILLGLAAASCTDIPPSTDYTCAQQVGWGKCSETWMTGYCMLSCGKCNATSEDTTDDASSVSGCVGIQTTLNGEVFAVGVNYAAHMWASGWMTDFFDSNWDTKFSDMKTELAAMKATGVRVIRWWLFARDDILPTSSWNGNNFTGLPTNFVDHLETAVNYAYSQGMLVYPTLMSFDWSKGSHQALLSSTPARQAWLDNAISPIVERLKNNPGVFAWDLCNEPEWMVLASDNGSPCSGCTGYSLATIKSFFNAVLSLIRNKGAKQPVSLGSASMKWLTQYELWNDMDLDFWDFHWYSWATPYFNPLSTAASSIKPVKKVIIGEIMPDISSDSVLTGGTYCDGGACKNHGQVLKQLATMGYSGYLPWAWTDPSYPAPTYMGTYEKDFVATCAVSGSTVSPVVVSSVSPASAPAADESQLGSATKTSIALASLALVALVAL